MSILLGPFEKGEPTESKENDKELLVFGYQCKLYRDDEKATMENDELLLIPWMGDRSLMVDRYDVRNRFDDKAQFGLKSNLPRMITNEEAEFEKLLEEERYYALGRDIMEEELLQEEQHKRAGAHQSGSYREVEFSYESNQARADYGSSQLLMDQPQRSEHMSTEYADDPDEGGEYERPFRLFIPPNITTPNSQKLHAVIERTALFVSKQGQQMEIIIKTKQRFNPSFSFLHHEDRLFPYYKHLLNCIMKGSFEPVLPKEENNTNKEEDSEAVNAQTTDQSETVTKPTANSISNSSTTSSNHDNDYDSDSEGELELHPILRANTNIPKTKPDSNTKTDSNNSVPNPDTLLNTKFKNRTFRNIAYTINSAPSVTETNGTNNTQDHDQEDHAGVSVPVSTEAGYTMCSGGYNPMIAYYQASQMYFVGMVPPPPNLQPVVDKTAEYVAKNGEHFESTIILKHLNDAKFDFLHPWNQYNRYYKSKVADYKESIQKLQENAPLNMQKLNVSGAVSFKMEVKGKPTPILEQRVDITEEDDGEDMPSSKKPKVAQEELAMDNTIKNFLLTVKGSFH